MEVVDAPFLEVFKGWIAICLENPALSRGLDEKIFKVISNSIILCSLYASSSNNISGCNLMNTFSITCYPSFIAIFTNKCTNKDHI